MPPSILVTVATLAALMVGCSTDPSSQSQTDSGDLGFPTTSFWFGDCEFMDSVAEALTRARIDYRRGENGSIRYRSEDNAAVRRISDDINSARRERGWVQGSTECEAESEQQ